MWNFIVFRLAAILLALGGCAVASQPKLEKRMLDESRAREYLLAWANKVGAVDDYRSLYPSGNSLYGKVGSLGFEYLPKDRALIVRYTVHARSTKMVNALNEKGGLAELQRAAQADFQTFGGATFETGNAPWDTTSQPSLFLRKTLTDGNCSVREMVKELVNFRDLGYVVNKVEMMKILRPFNARQRKEREEQTGKK